MLCAVVALGASAHVISPAEALQRLQGENGAVRRMAGRSAQHQITPIHALDATDPALYMVTSADGMMLLSADSEAEPLLGWTDEPSTGEIPPSLQYMMDFWSGEIEQLRAGQVIRTANAPTPDFAAIAPICTTRWNQNAPFNNLCPKVGTTATYTGCVATAMAQVLKTYNYPATGYGTNSYSWNSTTLSLDFSTITFDWENMLDGYSTSDTGTAADAVAQLMYACGIAANMSYGTGSSGATTTAMAAGLVRNFGFHSDLSVERRNWYTLTEWQTMIHGVLASGHPVFYTGSNDSSGHAFVIDGYSSDGYFHLNWGWGGASDGYFRLSALDPATQGIGGSDSGYNDGQDIIYGLRAEQETTGASRKQDFVVPNKFKVQQSASDLDTQITLEGGLSNISPVSSHQFIPSISITDSQGNVTYVYGTSLYTNCPTGMGILTWTVNLPDSKDMPDGVYTIRPVVRDYQTNEWLTPHTNLGQGYVLATVSDGKATFSEPTSGVEVTDLKLDADEIYCGTYFPINVTLKNLSASEAFSGNVRGQLLQTDGTTVVETYYAMKVDVDADGTVDLTYTPRAGSSLTAGKYLFTFIDEEEKSICANPIEVSVSSTAATGGTIACLSINCTKATRDQVTFQLEIECTDGYYTDPVRVMIFSTEQPSGYSLLTLSSPALFLKKDQTASVTLVGAMNTSFTSSTTYYAWPTYWNTSNSGNYVMDKGYAANFVLADATTTGIEAVEAEAEAEYFDLQGRRVAQPSHGIYLMRQGDKTLKVKL